MTLPKAAPGGREREHGKPSAMTITAVPRVRGDGWIQELAGIVEEESAKGCLVIAGIGHPLRSDDYVGSLIAKDLLWQTRWSGKVSVIDAENSPENTLPGIWKNQPRLVVLIDSLNAGLSPGSIILVDLDETSYPFYTTHNLPLRLILQAEPKVPRVILLGVQPGKLDVGGSLSEEVQQARIVIVKEIGRILERLRGDGHAY